jgi:hypothetical protein
MFTDSILDLIELAVTVRYFSFFYDFVIFWIFVLEIKNVCVLYC